MMRYTWKRILTGIVSLFLLATVTFFLVRLIPGSPFQRGGVSEQVVEAVEEEYGLNDPLIEQYLSYMGNLLKGDLGISYQDPGTSVEEIIGRAAPLTVSLGLSALIVSVIVGTGCGVFYAASEKRAVKKVIGSLGMLAAGIPGFAAAILLLMVFSVKLKWFPSSGLFSFSHYILPVTALSLYPSAYDAVHQSFFYVSSIITTTGFGLTDVNNWPEFSKTVIMIITFSASKASYLMTSALYFS